MELWLSEYGLGRLAADEPGDGPFSMQSLLIQPIATSIIKNAKGAAKLWRLLIKQTQLGL